MNDLLPLRSVLADPSMACVGYIADSERADYQAAAEALDYAVAAIDFSSCTGKDDALARFARALRFPDWFGDNWDGLQDCLSDLSWMPADGYLLLLTNTDDWRRADQESFDIALEVLEQAAAGWKVEHAPFWALVLVDDPFAG